MEGDGQAGGMMNGMPAGMGEMNQGWMDQEAMNQGTMGQGQMNMGMNGGMGQPMRKKMDSKKKKRIIMGVVLGIIAVIAVVVATVVIMLVSKVDYGEAYREVKGSLGTMADLSSNTGCSAAVNYVKDEYVTIDKYREYVELCRKAGEGVDEVVEKLAQTAAVKRDAEVKTQFERFQNAVNEAKVNREMIDSTLDLYETWHEFIVNVEELEWTSADAEFQTAARPLIQSGNEKLKVYGEGWLEKTLETAHLYQQRQRTSYFDANRDTIDRQYNDALEERGTWITANKPDVLAMGAIDTAKMKKVYEEYANLYRLMIEKYEQNYNSGSGDCLEAFGMVNCE